MSDFDKVAADWDKNDIHILRSQAIAEKLMPIIEQNNPKTALEFGAGTGLLSFLLKKKLNKIVLLDSSREMVNIASSKITESGEAGMEAVFCDLENQDYNQGTFDFVFSQMVLHHVENINLMFKKFHKLLNRGGLLAIADLYTEDGTFHSEGFTGHKGFDPEELGAKLRDTGFANPSYETCFTITKEASDGKTKNFPIFLITAIKQ